LLKTSILSYAKLASDVYDSPPLPINRNSSFYYIYASKPEYIKKRIQNLELIMLKEYEVERKKRILNQDARLGPIGIAVMGWQELYSYEDKQKNGFFARVYGNSLTADTVIVFRGTVLSIINHYKADIKLALGNTIDYLTVADDFYREAISAIIKLNKKKIKNIEYNLFPTFTGHSLGGYIAQYMGILYKRNTVVFNAPKIGGLHNAPGIGYIDPHGNYPYILNIDIDHDVIHRVGSRIGRQHLIHGDSSCAARPMPKVLKYNILANQVVAARMEIEGIRLAPCVFTQHYMSNVISKIDHVSNSKLLMEGYGD
jgi:hypothetical protein